MSTTLPSDRLEKTLTYRFQLETGEEKAFAVVVGRHDETHAPTPSAPASATSTRLPVLPSGEAGDLPEWTLLERNQCEGCPLPTTPGARCPPAVDCAAIIGAFDSTNSIDVVDVIVETPNREVHRRTDMQNAIGSLLGLVMATSGCPILNRFRGMAEFHLPFATPRETLFRAVGAHLLGQYFAHKRGDEPDLDLSTLRELYEDVQKVNAAFVARIRAAASRDANLNALVLWFTVAVLVTHSLEDGLEDLEELFGA